MLRCAEYIWLDGTKPTQQLRSKMRVLNIAEGKVNLTKFPEWGFDGSSTYQSEGHNSDLVLLPVSFVDDPLRGEGHFLVLCEVMNPDGTPHASNTRAKLREEMRKSTAQDPWVGFEQEFTLFKDDRPLGWPQNGYPAPQGPYYCAVGDDRIFGRSLSEMHAECCIEAGLAIYGTNAEVMPGQWEFQIGYRGIAGEAADPLTMSDHLWLSRWLLSRLGEDLGITVSLASKPIPGDWNGAGLHTNFSTKAMRDAKTGWAAIQQLVNGMSVLHKEHIAEYGDGLEQRLTGRHETCDINTFKSGERDRGASIRIPDPVSKKRCGYIEDRRPGANSDPYRVSARILQTLNGLSKVKKDSVKKKAVAAEVRV